MKSRFVLLFALAVFGCSIAAADTFTQTNLVSDGFVPAAHMDLNLKNPWGIANGGTGPFWVGDNGSDIATLYNSAGAPQPLVISMPTSGGGSQSPTGVAFNTAPSPTDFDGATYLFATEEGTVRTWKPSDGTLAPISVDSSASGSVYTGLAIVGNRLYVADFAGGKIDVFDSNFSTVTLPGGFTDPTLPSGFAPYNVQNIGGLLYVTYAKITGGAVGDGFIDVFDANGNLVRRLATGGVLANPWGLALAPVGFGSLGGDLLVGNFLDGKINAFDVTTGMLVQTLTDSTNAPIVNASLWGLTFGNGGNGGDPNTLYFTAGLENEQHGLLGSLTNDSPASTSPVPEPSSLLLIASGIGGVIARRTRR